MRRNLFCTMVAGLLAGGLLFTGAQAGGPAGSGGPGDAPQRFQVDTTALRAPVTTSSDPQPEGGAALVEVFRNEGWPVNGAADGNFGFGGNTGTHNADDFMFPDGQPLVMAEMSHFFAGGGFIGDANCDDPGSNFFLRIWPHDPDTGLPGPVGDPIFVSGPHELNDGTLQCGEFMTGEGGAVINAIKFNFGFEFFVAEPGVRYWIGLTADPPPGQDTVGSIVSDTPTPEFGMVQAGTGDWVILDLPPAAGDVDIPINMAYALWAFDPTGGTTVVSMSGTSAGGGCPLGGCCIRITPTTAPISACDGGECLPDPLFGADCFAEVSFPGNLSADNLAIALKLAFDTAAGCDSDLISALNVGPRLIVTTTDGTKPKLCLSINQNDIGVLGGREGCTAAGCGYNYQVGPTVTLPSITAGPDRYSTVLEDCALPDTSDEGTWIDLDLAGGVDSIFNRPGVPDADAVNTRVRLSGVARNFAIDNSDMAIVRKDDAVFGLCSGDFSRLGDQGTSFSPDGIVNDADLAAFDANCAGQSEPFAGDCDFFDYNGDDVIDSADRLVLECLAAAGNTFECCPNRVSSPGVPDLPQDASNIVNTELTRLHLRSCDNLVVTRGGLSENWIVDMYASGADPRVGASVVPDCEPGDNETPPANLNDIIENADDIALLAENAPRRFGGEIKSTDCDFAPLWFGDQDADVYRFTIAFPTAVEISATGVDANPGCAGGQGAVTSLWLYDDRGVKIASDDPAGARDPIIQADLDSGEYFILIAAAGQVQEPLPNGFPPSFPDCSIAFAPEVDGGNVDPTGAYDLSLTVIPGSTMRISQSTETSGTYSARTLYQPLVTYQRVCDPSQAVLIDTGGSSTDAFVLASTGPWTKAPPQDIDLMPGDANFVPGVDDAGATPLIALTEDNGLGFAQRVQATVVRECPTIFDNCAYSQTPDASEALGFITANTSTVVDFPVADNFTVDTPTEIQSVTFWVRPAGAVTKDHTFDVRILGTATAGAACAIGIPDESNVLSDGASGEPFILPTTLTDIDQITLNLLDAFVAQPGDTYWVELSVNTAQSPAGAISFVTSLEGDGVFFQDTVPAAGQAGDNAGDCEPLNGDGWDCDATADDLNTECDESNADGDQRTDGNLAFCAGTTRAEILTKTLPTDTVVGSWREAPGAIVWTQPFQLAADGVIGFFSDLSLGTNGGNQAADSFVFFEDTTITGVNWRGAYDETVVDPAADNFRIELWSDGGGVPDAIIPGGIFTPTNSEIDRAPGILSGNPGRQVFEYSYQLSTPIVATSDERLWLSVVNDLTGQSYNWIFVVAGGGNSDGTAALRAGLNDNPPWQVLGGPADTPTDFSFDITVAGTSTIICGDAAPGGSGLGYRFDNEGLTVNGIQGTEAAGTRWRNINAPWKNFDIVPANGATAADVGSIFADMGVTLSPEQIDTLIAGLPEGTLVASMFTGVAAFDTDPDLNGISLGGTLSATCNGAVTESVDPTIGLGQQMTATGILGDDGSVSGMVSGGETPPPEILHQNGLEGQTHPHSGFIDPAVESSNGVDLNRGLQSAEIRFTQPVFKCGGGTLDASNFVMSETGGGTPPNVTGVTMIEGAYAQVDWDRPLTLQEWTTITAVNVCNAEGAAVPNMGDMGAGVNEPDRVDLGFLPADVNQNGAINPLDLLKFKQYINDIQSPPIGEEFDLTNINRDGLVNPLDLLTFKRLINNIPPATQSWNFTSMNNTQP